MKETVASPTEEKEWMARPNVVPAEEIRRTDSLMEEASHEPIPFTLQGPDTAKTSQEKGSLFTSISSSFKSYFSQKGYVIWSIAGVLLLLIMLCVSWCFCRKVNDDHGYEEDMVQKVSHDAQFELFKIMENSSPRKPDNQLAGMVDSPIPIHRDIVPGEVETSPLVKAKMILEQSRKSYLDRLDDSMQFANDHRHSSQHEYTMGLCGHAVEQMKVDTYRPSQAHSCISSQSVEF